MTLLVLVLSAIATISKADGFCVVSIDPDYKETVLKDVIIIISIIYFVEINHYSLKKLKIFLYNQKLKI